MKNNFFPFPVVMGIFLICGIAGCRPNGNSGSAVTLENETRTAGSGRTVDPIPVRVLTLAPGNFIEYEEYYGEVTGIQEAQIISSSGGRVERINVKTGDFVRAGTSLASIEGQRAENELSTARLNARIAREEYERQQQFLGSGNASQVEVDTAHLAWLSAQNTLLEAENDYEGAFCITPIAGNVISSFIEEFRQVAPGTLAFIVSDLSQLRIVIGVPEAELVAMKSGDPVRIAFSTMPENSWNGSVYSIGQKVTPGSLTYPVEIRMKNTARLFLSGAVATVRVIRSQYTNRIIVPIQAVLTEGDVHYAMIVEGEVARRRDVEIEHTGETEIVIQRGLSSYDRLIVEGQHIADEGLPVRVVE